MRKGKGGRRLRGGMDWNGGDAGKESIPTALGALWFSNFPSLPVYFSIVATATEWGWKEGERYCDRGRESALEKRHLSEGWGGCYDNYLYSRLSVMFHWSLERRRGMEGGEELRKEGLEKGSFLHLSAELECEFDCQLGDKDKL